MNQTVSLRVSRAALDSLPIRRWPSSLSLSRCRSECMVCGGDGHLLSLQEWVHGVCWCATLNVELSSVRQSEPQSLP